MVSHKRIRDSVLLGMAGILFVLVAPQEFYHRMGTIQLSGPQTEASAMNRANLARAAYEATLDHPLFGLGPNCWILEAERYAGDRHEPHNAWLKTSVEYGIPGLFIYVTILLVTLARLFRLRNRAIQENQPQIAAMTICLIISLFGFILPSTFLNHPFSEFLWAQMAIANALVARYPHWEREDEEDLTEMDEAQA